jgi:hypothetical protein
MPIEIRDVDGSLGNLITATGFLSQSEYVEAIRQHLTQDGEKFRGYSFSLSDYNGITGADVPTRAIESVASMCKRAADLNPDAVVAVVAERDLEYGLSRMWEVLCDDVAWEIRVFRRSEEARNWIMERVKDRWNITDLTFD